MQTRRGSRSSRSGDDHPPHQGEALDPLTTRTASPGGAGGNAEEDTQGLEPSTLGTIPESVNPGIAEGPSGSTARGPRDETTPTERQESVSKTDFLAAMKMLTTAMSQQQAKLTVALMRQQAVESQKFPEPETYHGKLMKEYQNWTWDLDKYLTTKKWVYTTECE